MALLFVIAWAPTAVFAQQPAKDPRLVQEIPAPVQEQKFSGRIVRIDTTNRTITVRNDVGMDQIIPIDVTTQIQSGGKASSLGNLEVGDRIEISIKNDLGRTVVSSVNVPKSRQRATASTGTPEPKGSAGNTTNRTDPRYGSIAAGAETQVQQPEGKSDHGAGESDTYKAQTGQSQSDLNISREIQRALVEDRLLSSAVRHVQIDARDGTVTLKGSVSSDEEKNRVAQIARKVPGVTQVINRLQVRALSLGTDQK